jgi:hypothetical protein
MVKKAKYTYWYWVVLLIMALIVFIVFFEYGESFGKAIAK